jgi:hypothetical protein
VHIELADVVLFLHISAVIVSFMMAAVLHAAFHVMPRASVAELRPWARLIHRLEPLLPLSALFILGFGAWLVHLDHGQGAGWSDGWVLTPLITLVLIEALAGTLLAPRARAMVEAVQSAPDGPVSADLRSAMLNPYVWYVGHVATFGFLGVVFVMAVKPSGGIAWLFPVVGAALGIALSRLQLLAHSRATVDVRSGDSAVPAPRSTSEPASVHEA